MPRRPRFVLAAGLVTLGLAATVPLLGRQVVAPPPPPPPGSVLTPTGQDPQSSQAAQPTPTGLVLGQVVDAATGRPVPSAIVTLLGRPPAAPPGPSPIQVAVDTNRAMTNSEGRFVFRAVANGSFGLTATAPGYMSGSYGQTRPQGPTHQLEITDGEQIVQGVIKLWKYASIAGAVVDENGDPAVGIQVRAVRRTFSSGKPRFSGFSSATTDDRGMYRIPSIAPGDYVVAAPTTVTNVPTSAVDAYLTAAQSGMTSDLIAQYSANGAPFPSANGIRIGDQQLQMTGRGSGPPIPMPVDGGVFIYQTTYHPATTVATQADVITLGSGDERLGVDLQLKLVKAAKVSGVVMGLDGPAANLGVRLVPSDTSESISDSGYETAIASTDGKGQFSFVAVPTGQYTLKVQRVPRPVQGPGTTTTIVTAGGTTSYTTFNGPSTQPSTEPTLWAQQSVTVADTDVSGLVVSLHTGARLSGHIVFSGTTATPPDASKLSTATLTVTAIDQANFILAVQNQNRADASGQFTTGQYLPGKYWLSVSGSFPPWTLKSIVSGGHNLLMQPLELGSTDVADLVVTYSDQASEISGIVRDGAGVAATDAVVFIFPADYPTWIANGMAPRLSRTVTVGKTGAFTFGGLLDGAYLAVAVPTDVAVDTQDPKWYAKLAPAGTRISITAGDKKQQDLALSRIH